MYSRKSYQKIPVSNMEKLFKSQDIAKVLNSDSHIVWTQSTAQIHTKKFITREGEIGEKIRACHSFQNTSISQRRTSQMIRRSPTAFERRIYGLTITWQNISSFQLGERRGYWPLGLLFPKKLVFWLGLITFRRVGFSICVHCFSVISKIMTRVSD